MNFGLGPMMSTSGAWEDNAGRFSHKGMYFGDRGMDVSLLGMVEVLHLVTWFLVVALLVVLVRYFWKLGDKIK